MYGPSSPSAPDASSARLSDIRETAHADEHAAAMLAEPHLVEHRVEERENGSSDGSLSRLVPSPAD